MHLLFALILSSGIMSIGTPVLLLTHSDTADSYSYTTPSFTLPANQHVFLAVVHSGGTTNWVPTITSVSDPNATWTYEGFPGGEPAYTTVALAGASATVHLFRGHTTSVNIATTATVQFPVAPPSAPTSLGLVMWWTPGVLRGNLGAGSVRQVHADSTIVSPLSVTLSSALASTSSKTVGVFMADDALTVTGNGTQIAQISYGAAPTIYVSVQQSSSTTLSASFTGATRAGGLAAETLAARVSVRGNSSYTPIIYADASYTDDE